MKLQIELPDPKFKVGDVVCFAGASGDLYFQITGWEIYSPSVKITPTELSYDMDVDALTSDLYYGNYISPGKELGFSVMMRDVIEADGELFKEAA